eukprot:6654946-Pyramimonas_sp.AAC.1
MFCQFLPNVAAYTLPLSWHAGGTPLAASTVLGQPSNMFWQHAVRSDCLTLSLGIGWGVVAGAEDAVTTVWDQPGSPCPWHGH